MSVVYSCGPVFEPCASNSFGLRHSARSLAKILFLFLPFLVSVYALLFAVSSLSLAADNPAIGGSSNGRIGVRISSQTPEFYIPSTDASFVPRGFNYIRLSSLPDPWGGRNFNHSLFVPGHYIETKVDEALRGMSQKGYNTVRVFVSELSSGRSDGPGVDPQYVANLVNFINRAWHYRIRVIVTFWNLPRNGGYQPEEAPHLVEGINSSYLNQPNIEKKKLFLADFIRSTISGGAHLEGVLSWQIENEVAFNERELPFSLNRGQFKSANGRVYNLSRDEERRALMEDSLVHWANELTTSVKSVDPHGLVSVSVFSPLAVSGPDPRVIFTKKLMQDPEQGGSFVDFVDLHVYPGFHSLEREMNSFEIPESRKPVIIGEMGIYFPNVSPRHTSAEIALQELRDFQILSCNYRVKGWLTYTWDTTETANGSRDLYTGLDANATIADGLAPAYLSDPCKPVTASRQ